MIYVVYASSAVHPFSGDELMALLARSRRNNERLGLTGMLLYKDGNFMQVLEGEESAVDGLLEKIGRDPRHGGMMKLLRGTVDERQFDGWSMAFQDLSSNEAKAVPGYSEFLNTPLTAEQFAPNPGRCWKLLQTFKKNMR